MNILMDLLNQCYTQSSCWKFHVLQESTWEWVDLQICYDNSKFNLKSSNNWNKNDLVNLYWEAGLISDSSEADLEEWIRKESLIQRVRGIAPDTNLIIPGFVSTFLKSLPQGGHDIIPVLVLFARSIQYEIHTMREYTYSRVSSRAETCFSEALHNWPLLEKLWNTKKTSSVAQQLSDLSNKRGRLGIKGSYEVDALHKWAPVIIIKPTHILHSPKVLEDTPFLNAVHDSLIRYEVDFVSQNTSLPIMFITNDKDQCKAAQQEGIKSLYIQRPRYSPSLDSECGKKLSLEHIRRLILGLLTYSSAIRMTSQSGEYYLSWTWRGRKITDITDHRIRLVDSKAQSQILIP